MDTLYLQSQNTNLKIENEQLKKQIVSLTDRSKSETARKESQVRFKTVFESSRLGNKILDSNLRILEVNAALLNILGCDSKEDLLGKSIIKFAPADKRDGWRSLQDKLWSKATPSFSLETCLTKKDGTVIWCQITSILFEDHGETLGYTIVEDITDQHKLRTQKEAFITMASHELQTPLTGLQAGLQVMSRIIENETVITDKLRKISKSVELNVFRMGSLVRDLLSTTQIEQGQLTINKSKFMVSNLIDSCCGHIQLTGNYTLVRDYDESLVMFADEHKIEQVLLNFIANAIKYAPESKEIVVRMERFEDFFKVSVIDKGKGIAQANCSKIFDRYYQINKDMNSSSGLGLGLFISSEIIKRHDGEIGVDSTLGEGSTFWFTVPN